MTTNPTQLRATITVEEAGRLMGISRGAAYRGVAHGQIPAIRVGRRLLAPTARLYQLLGLAPDHAPEAAAAPPEEDGEGR